MSASIWWPPGRFQKHYLRPFLRYLTDRETYRRVYEPSDFFDQFHGLGEDGVDGDTISPGYPTVDATYHYNAVENGIIAHFKRHGIEPATVLDIGSGSGHWVQFYSSVYAPGAIHGADISAESVRKLQKRFEGMDTIHAHHTDLLASSQWDDGTFNVINAIGVMFHIVDDQKWERTVRWCADKLKPGGVFVVGGLFGPFTANVQFNPVRFNSAAEMERGTTDLACNKRVRSRWKWKRTLKSCGFRQVAFRRTPIPRWIKTPENNLLFAVK
jgi:SAM-dependent methyltransferase